MKKFLIAILCLLTMVSLTACGEKQEPIVDENGDVIHYEEAEIAEGYYILKDDGFYYKITNAGCDTDNNGNIFTWFTEPYDAAIPRMTTKDKLLFYSETTRPESLTLYKMTDYGYTLGILFNVEDNSGDLKHPQIINFSQTFNPYSLVQSVVESTVTGGATTYITGINNHDFSTNLLVDNSFLKGLTKDTMYQLEMYCGTVRKTVNIKADTHLFLQESTYTTSSYEELKTKCFQIYLPSNLNPGYYYCENFGLFYYEGTIDSIDDDTIDNLIEADENTEQQSENNDVEEVIGDTDEIVENNETTLETVEEVIEETSTENIENGTEENQQTE